MPPAVWAVESLGLAIEFDRLQLVGLETTCLVTFFSTSDWMGNGLIVLNAQ